MKLLLLGGTADAQRLARELMAHGIEVVYSIAGLVRAPTLECRVIRGGFSAQGGLADFIEREAIDAVLDATHPYAARMSATVHAVTRDLNRPLWRYQRPPWRAQPGDDWHEFDNWSDLAGLLQVKRSVFFTAGQPAPEFLEHWQSVSNGVQRLLVRTATPPVVDLSASMEWIEAIGPFDLDTERALFARYTFDALVSKNSGGDATVAKLVAARESGVPVYLLRRPVLPDADTEFDAVEPCVDFVAARQHEVA